MKEGNRGLNQSLKKWLLWANLLAPEVLEHIMAGKEFAFIEQANAFINTWVREVAGSHCQESAVEAG
jgi:hypothetical protein